MTPEPLSFRKKKPKHRLHAKHFQTRVKTESISGTRRFQLCVDGAHKDWCNKYCLIGCENPRIIGFINRCRPNPHSRWLLVFTLPICPISYVNIRSHTNQSISLGQASCTRLCVAFGTGYPTCALSPPGLVSHCIRIVAPTCIHAKRLALSNRLSKTQELGQDNDVKHSDSKGKTKIFQARRGMDYGKKKKKKSKATAGKG